MSSNKYVSIDCRVSDRICDALRDRGFTPIEIPVHEGYDKPIAAHPDVFAFCDGNTVISDAKTVRTIKERMSGEERINFIVSKEITGETILYPADCGLNAALCGNVLIGRKASLDTALTVYAENRAYHIADVRQGYAKCNCAVINDHALITEDAGIAEKCAAFGIDVLLLHTHAVSLDGYPYGFIGGACGLYRNTLYVVGDITKHPEYNEIEFFTKKHGIIIDTLCGGEITDVGSLLFFGAE